MSANEILLFPRGERGWRMGLANMLAKENFACRRTRRWWIQILVAVLILNGSLALNLRDPQRTSIDQQAINFLTTSALFVPIIVAILAQDAILNERHAGTTAWVFSKPLKRPAFILSKLIAYGLGFLVTWPTEALLGTIGGDPNVGPGVGTKRMWADSVTENPAVGATEVWEIYNTTVDAHPMHIHEVVFQVVNRQDIFVDEENKTVQVVPGSLPTPPEPWETGFKDTVTAYPGQVTRVKAQFNTPGQFVWHCHIVEHEDNEMMRPYRIGPVQPGQPG